LYPALVVAGLTALRAYVVAGCPSHLRKGLGSFESWDKVVPGGLLWCGYADPCATRDRLISDDPERMSDLELLSTWHAAYRSSRVTPQKINAKQNKVYKS